MKAVIVADVYCPYSCGAVLKNLENGKHCVCTSPNCKGHGVLFLRPSIVIEIDRLAEAKE